MTEKQRKSNKEKGKAEKQLSPYLKFTTVAIQMGVTIYLGSELGNWLDFKYESTFGKPTFTLLSVVIAIYVIIKQVTKISNNN